MKISKTSLRVLHAMSVASITAGHADGMGADMEEVRDLLIARFQMTRTEADEAIELARAEGVIVPGDPQP